MAVGRGIIRTRERRVRRTGRARDVRRIMRLCRFVVPLRYLDLVVPVGCWFGVWGWNRDLRSVLDSGSWPLGGAMIKSYCSR